MLSVNVSIAVYYHHRESYVIIQIKKFLPNRSNALGYSLDHKYLIIVWIMFETQFIILFIAELRASFLGLKFFKP